MACKKLYMTDLLARIAGFPQRVCDEARQLAESVDFDPVERPSVASRTREAYALVYERLVWLKRSTLDEASKTQMMRDLKARLQTELRVINQEQPPPPPTQRQQPERAHEEQQQQGHEQLRQMASGGQQHEQTSPQEPTWPVPQRQSLDDQEELEGRGEPTRARAGAADQPAPRTSSLAPIGLSTPSSSAALRPLPALRPLLAPTLAPSSAPPAEQPAEPLAAATLPAEAIPAPMAAAPEAAEHVAAAPLTGEKRTADGEPTAFAPRRRPTPRHESAATSPPPPLTLRPLDASPRKAVTAGGSSGAREDEASGDGSRRSSSSVIASDAPHALSPQPPISLLSALQQHLSQSPPESHEGNEGNEVKSDNSRAATRGETDAGAKAEAADQSPLSTSQGPSDTSRAAVEAEATVAEQPPSSSSAGAIGLRNPTSAADEGTAAAALVAMLSGGGGDQPTAARLQTTE